MLVVNTTILMPTQSKTTLLLIKKTNKNYDCKNTFTHNNFSENLLSSEMRKKILNRKLKILRWQHWDLCPMHEI